MVTPFKVNNEQNNKWTIWVKLVNGKIHLCTAEDDNQHTEIIAKHFQLLQNYLFVRKPILCHRQILPQLHYHFYQVYKLNIGNIQLIYPVEISGVKYDNTVTNVNDLIAADHVYCDIFKDGEFSPEIINYNPVWWSKAVLMKATKCFIGVYKEQDRISEIIQFTIDKFNETENYENLWSPKAAWNFLQATLIFIKESINNVKSELRNDCVWKVENFVNNNDFVTCQPLIRSIVGANVTYKPLPITALKF
ncbi:hypothetical protein O3M35_002387 [Rhynocoris fuscipes]|uniref:RAI1-like domain-containing protein n=1 Tax=Rhynocoris fuscipes TaxID=488301 RepID=A0AAW1CP79_9HEMI